MNETTFAAVFTVLCLALYGLLKLAAWSERRHKAEVDEALALLEPPKDFTPARFVNPEPMVPIVPGSTEPELVDELPVRAQAIEVPREGAPSPVHYNCADHWFDRRPSLVCDECLPVLRAKAVA